MLVRQTPKHDFFRSIIVFSRKETQLKIRELVIKDDNGNYTNDFTALLKDYYLQLLMTNN